MITNTATYELSCQIYIRDNQGGNLNVSETVTVKAQSFLEIAQILGRFHELVQTLKTQKP